MSDLNHIKETISFRQKDLDNYLEKTKKLLISKGEIETRLVILNKNLKVTKKELDKLNNWLINNNEVKIEWHKTYEWATKKKF